MVRLFTAACTDGFEFGDLVGGAAGAIVVGAIVGGAVGAGVVGGIVGGEVGAIVVGRIFGLAVGGVGAFVGAAPCPGVNETSSIAMSPKKRAHLCVMIPIN